MSFSATNSPRHFLRTRRERIGAEAYARSCGRSRASGADAQTVLCGRAGKTILTLGVWKEPTLSFRRSCSGNDRLAAEKSPGLTSQSPSATLLNYFASFSFVRFRMVNYPGLLGVSFAENGNSRHALADAVERNSNSQNSI